MAAQHRPEDDAQEQEYGPSWRPPPRDSTGIAGLDAVLGGGLPGGGMYLVEGAPGVGKTTLGLQFLLAGARQKQKSLYVAMSESKREILAVAASHGWSLAGVEVFEQGSEQRGRDAEQTMFVPAEIELEEATRPIFEAVERSGAERVVVDPLSVLRLLAQDELRYRRQLLAMKHFFARLRCTVVVIDTVARTPSIAHTLVAGVLRLEKLTPLYGTTRRHLSVEKMRGIEYREGFHDYRIKRGGVVVHPRLVAAEHVLEFEPEQVPSGLPELDALLGGGIDRGSSTLLMGSAGTGKSSLATQYAASAAARGENVLMFTFEESINTWIARTRALGFDLERHLVEGRLRIVQVDPAELSPGELAQDVREAVEHGDVRMVVFDSLNGYLQSMPEENFLMLHLHELLTYLGQRGVTTLLIMAQHGLLGAAMSAPIDVSYLADTVVLLRYFEVMGEVRQALSVLKKRSGAHERTIRELRLDARGIHVGRPLVDFQGVLSGVPDYRGAAAPLMKPGA